MPFFFSLPQLMLNQVDPFHSTTQLLSFLWVWWSCNCGLDCFLILFFRIKYLRWFMIYFVVHRCVDVHGGGGGGVVIVGLYHFLLLLFLGILSSRLFTIYTYSICGINSFIFLGFLMFLNYNVLIILHMYFCIN